MLTLFHAPRSRSTRIIWLLEELGADYEIRTVAIRRRDPSSQDPGATVGERDPANPHPHGKVPAILHDGALVTESAAIVLYLTDAFPERNLGPAIGDEKRGPYLSWLAYYPGVAEPSFTSAFLGVQAAGSATAWAPLPEVMAHIEAALARGPYLLGESFSGADILFGSTFAYFLDSPLVPDSDHLRAYVERLTARPAYQSAQAKDDPAAA
jgi:glutathione S-transferase